MNKTLLYWIIVFLSAQSLLAVDQSEIYAAVRGGEVRPLQDLLAKGFSANDRDGYGETLLMRAVVYGKTDAVKFLLEKGADVNGTNFAGATALMRAAGDAAKTKLLIDRGANVNARSGLGNTPLILAARAANGAACVEFLIGKGAEIGATNQFGANAILTASASGNLKSVEALLKHGADVNSHSRASQAVALWGGGRSPLMWAAVRGDIGLAKVLLAAGADINAQEGFGTPLTQAAWMGRVEMAKFLIEHGANVNDAERFSGFTALHWAASGEGADASLVKLLLEHGANVNAEGGEPVDAYLGIAQTPLMLARRRGDTEIVKVLVAAGGKENPFPVQAVNAAARDLPGGASAKNIRMAVERAVPGLQSTAISSKDAFVRHASKQDCVSCHQQLAPMAAISLAGKGGVKVDASADEKLLAIVRRDTTNSMELAFEATFHPEPANGYGYTLFALGVRGEAASPETDAFVHHLLTVQGKDGNWFNNLPRPPIQTSDVGATAFAINALERYGFPARADEIHGRVERARHWLAGVHPANTEERVFQILGLVWAGEKASHLQALAGELLKEQRADGGWGQLGTLRTDAYATGQALYALHLAGTRTSAPQFQRGLEYLLKSQEEDGSWHVARRAFPFQPTMQSGFAHGKDGWISSSGTSWATMALSLGLTGDRQQASVVP